MQASGSDKNVNGGPAYEDVKISSSANVAKSTSPFSMNDMFMSNGSGERMQEMDAKAPPPSMQHVEDYSLMDQYASLFKKSFIAQKRQYKTNLCQIVFPVTLIVLLFVLQILVDSIIQSEFGGKYRDAIANPLVKRSAFFLDRPTCLNVPLHANPIVGHFSVNGNFSDVGSFRDPATNTGGSGLFGTVSFVTGPYGALPSVPVRGIKNDFELGEGTGTECDPYTMAMNPTLYKFSDGETFRRDMFNKYGKPYNNYLAAYDFKTLDLSTMKAVFTAYVNKTMGEGRDLGAITNFISNALYRKIKNEDSPATFLKLAGVKDFPTPKKEVGFDIISVAGPFIYLYVFQLLLPVFMSNLVNEKELKLREIMRMMGLKTHVYWVVNYIFHFSLYAAATIVVIVIAYAMGFRTFTENVFISYFALFFCWGHVLVALGWVLSTLFSSSTTATAVGYLWVFITGILSSTLIQNFFQDTNTAKGVLVLIQVIPSFTFYRGLWALREGVYLQPGYTLENLKETDWVPLQEVYIVLLIEWFALVLLAMYLENIVPSDIGVSKSCCFCFKRGESPCLEAETDENALLQFAPKGSANILNNGEHSLPADKRFPADVTVAREHARTDLTAPVRILDLVKVFPSRDGGVFRAVDNLSMTINDHECLGFLGPNGAGKSTTINMLCGYLAPDAGTAFLAGRDIRHDMDAVHMIMGVCPQENVLWTDLTSGEHLEFYGRLKGLRGADLEKAIIKGLEEVNLLEVRNKKCGEYSGGMKRRLCVAISLIGNPRIILLDEPTTGLDPGARRALWAVIKRAKQRSAILLTTHSMEEAEMLCDRMAVFKAGQLSVIDSSANLKQRFVKGLKLSVTFEDPNKEEGVIDLVKRHSTSCEILSNIGGVIAFELPKDTTKLANVFGWMEASRARLSIIDWALSNTTLEEAFVHIASGKYEQEELLQHMAHVNNDNNAHSAVTVESIAASGVAVPTATGGNASSRTSSSGSIEIRVQPSSNPAPNTVVFHPAPAQ